MSMTPKDELLDEILKRLHDPGAFVERLGEDKTGKREQLKLWQLRAIETLFEVIDKREVDGKVTLVMRTPFKDKDSDV